MPKCKVTHIKEQERDVIIVLLPSDFSRKETFEKNRTRVTLQKYATDGGLTGVVVIAWDAGGGRCGFLAPPHLQAFLKTITLEQIYKGINEEISW